MNRTQKQKAYQKGVWAEYLAAVILMLKGYRILRHRYKCRAGEIDLIVRKGKALIAIEVKAHRRYQSAVEAVTLKSRRRITAALSHFIMVHPQYAAFDMRFDVVAVFGGCLIRHLDNAWRPDA